MSVLPRLQVGSWSRFAGPAIPGDGTFIGPAGTVDEGTVSVSWRASGPVDVSLVGATTVVVGSGAGGVEMVVVPNGRYVFKVVNTSSVPLASFEVSMRTVLPADIIGVVTDKGGQVFNVKAYDAKGDGVTDDTAAIQATLDAMGAGDNILFPPGTYVVSSALVVSKDINILAYGATLKYTGSGNYPMWVNSEVVNITWFGGTVDGNGVAGTMVAFGGSGGAAIASSAVASCAARDIDFINIAAGAWTANQDANTNVTWDNLTCTVDASNIGADMFELTGTNLSARVYGTPGATNAAVLTSSYAIGADFNAYVLGGTNTNKTSLMLQAFPQGTIAAPWFRDVHLRGNGAIQLANGDLSTPTTVSAGRITINCDSTNSISVGSSANDVWDSVALNGNFVAVDGGAVAIYAVNTLTVDLAFDLSGITSTNAGAVLFNGAASRVVVSNLVAVGPASAVEGIFYGGTTANVEHFSVDGGDVTGLPIANNPMFAGTTANIGTSSKRVANVAGYNPAVVNTPSVPAVSTAVTNTTGVDVDVYVAGGAGGTTSVNGTSTGIGNGTFYLPAGGTIDLGAYTTAPTWVWVGR